MPTHPDLPVPTESVEQQRLFMWARMESAAHPELEWLYHIPNEGKRSRITGARLKAEGLKTGVPDICLPIPRNGLHGLYIELKRERGSRVTPDQLKWIEELARQGYQAAVCLGADEAMELIRRYLGF